VASTQRPLASEEIGARLRAHFGQDITDVIEQHGHTVVSISVQRYRDLVRFLRDEPEFACDYCDFTGGVDWGDRFQVITHLFSTTHHHNVRIKVSLPHEDPVCPTISDLFPTANWHERETREMFGIEFEGHPQPVKLLLSEQFEGQPLRKDFKLMSREAKPWPGAVEGEEEEEE
jgi:NADH-quinone oxidoreductase subunit C